MDAGSIPAASTITSKNAIGWDVLQCAPSQCKGVLLDFFPVAQCVYFTHFEGFFFNFQLDN